MDVHLVTVLWQKQEACHESVANPEILRQLHSIEIEISERRPRTCLRPLKENSPQSSPGRALDKMKAAPFPGAKRAPSHPSD
jgi:hypothetical protein